MKRFNLHKRPTLYFIRLFAVFFALFFVMRLAFLWVYPETFADLSAGTIAYAMLKGAWFIDSSIIMVFLGIPFLLTYLPFKWFVSRLYLSFIAWYAYLVFFVFALVAIGDLLYFGMVQRHTGHEIAAALGASLQAMFDMIISDYWAHLLALLGVMVVVGYWWFKWMMPSKHIEHLSLRMMRVPFFIVMFLVILLAMRGGIESKPIQAVFAYSEGPMAQGHLTLNGVFATFHSLHSSKMHVPNYMPLDEAVSIVQEMYESPHEIYPDTKYPLMRERTSMFPTDKKLNVVILLLESWDPNFIDISRELVGKKPYGVTPNYNALAKKGRLYTNFYANAQRSIDGISAVISGIPRLPGMGGFGEGIETNAIGWMADAAKKQGYETSFLRAAYRHSSYMDKIAPLAGFDSYHGWEDLTPHHPGEPKSDWGGWDYDLFLTGHDLYEKAEKPFLSVMFTVSTHTPWALPEPNRWNKLKGDGQKERFLNAMYYTDWALGQYFNKVKDSHYAKNTVFILVADHASGNIVQPEIREQYRVPLLMIGPNIEPGIDETLSSQIDLIPTIIDLAGWTKSRYASLGRSLVEDTTSRSVIFGRDAMTGRIEDNNVLLVRSLERILHKEGEPQQILEADIKLQAQLQVLLNVLQHNKLMKPDAD